MLCTSWLSRQFCSKAFRHSQCVWSQHSKSQCNGMLWLQGAFMAALYSQGLAWEQMHHLVREYARQMSSVQHLLWDLTLPIMSVFNGVGFDRVVRETFKHGAQQIEDLWLRWAHRLIVASSIRDSWQKRCNISSRKTASELLGKHSLVRSIFACSGSPACSHCMHVSFSGDWA